MSRSTASRALARLAPLALLATALAPATARAEAEPSVPTVSAAPIDPDAFADFVPGEIAVDFDDAVDDAGMADLARAVGVTLSPSSAWSHAHDKIEIAKVDPSELSSVLARLREDPRVKHAEPMSILHASWVPDDPFYRDQWHMPRVGTESAWHYGCGAGVTVAVIDTGVACFDHGPFSKGTDLHGTRCVKGHDFVNNREEAADDHGHGTHVAGTVAQTTNNGKGVAGLAHCANLMPIKVLSKAGWGTVADVASGIRFAADHGAQVINMSLGGRIKSKILEDAVNHAIAKGVVVVAAAGNSRKSVEWPAAYPGVVAVSATDSKDALAWFSSRGPELAIAAPGVDVLQQTVCNGGHDKCEVFGKFSGTSMAAPHVAGAAALIVSAGVTEPSAVRAALQVAARQVDGHDPAKYGAGVLDAAAAVARAHWTHVALRVAALFAIGWLVARRIRKQGGTPRFGKGAIFGALLAGVGLLAFAPLLGVAPRLGATRWVLELFMRPLGEWDVVFDAGLHKWLPLANAIPAIGVAALFYGSKRLRPFVGGFALGAAALAAQLAWSAEVATPFGVLLTRLWLVANALVCVALARLALDDR